MNDSPAARTTTAAMVPSSAASPSLTFPCPSSVFPAAWGLNRATDGAVGPSRRLAREEALVDGEEVVAPRVGQRQAGGEETHLELVRAHQDALLGRAAGGGALSRPAARRAAHESRAPRAGGGRFVAEQEPDVVFAQPQPVGDVPDLFVTLEGAGRLCEDASQHGERPHTTVHGLKVVRSKHGVNLEL